MNRMRREAIARRAVERSRADQTEVRIGTSDESLTRFTHGISNQNVAADDVTIAVRAIVNGRTGVAAANDSSDASVKWSSTRHRLRHLSTTSAIN